LESSQKKGRGRCSHFTEDSSINKLNDCCYPVEAGEMGRKGKKRMMQCGLACHDTVGIKRERERKKRNKQGASN
jgi:hypothetical protein